jgi:hypothetical protein
MSSIHYCAAWTECGCLVICGHAHLSIGEAVSCIPTAGAYVVAVDAGTMRSLSSTEETEFQIAVHRPPAAHPAANVPVTAVGTAIDSRYAVMTRMKAGTHWRWTTWMCFATHAEATAQAREGDKVVRFRSADWQELRRQTAVASPSHASADARILPEVEDETLVEYVFRTLSTSELEQNSDRGSTVEWESITSEGIQDRERQKRKRA